jgi:signal transduction histidine kinase
MRINVNKDLLTMTAALAVALVIAAVLPAGYFFITYEYLAGSLEAEAEMLSHSISEVISRNPELWQFEQVRLKDLLASRGPVKDAERQEIIDAQGRFVVQNGEALPALQIRRAHELRDAGDPVASIVISRSLSDVVLRTAFLGLLGLAIGAGVFFLLHIAPRRTKERLKRNSDDLQEMNDELKSFAYIMSHDLRAPLVSIKGFSQELEFAIKDLHGLLQQRLPDMDAGDRKKAESLLLVDVPEAVHYIGSSVTRMDKMIGSILSLSRMSRRELKPEPLDLGAIVRTILDSLAHQIAERRIDVTVAPFPAITADRSAIEQILGNLMDNAVKYLDPGRPGTIAVTAEDDGREIVVHVRDNGRGMAQEDIPKAFELFRRVGSHDVPGEGMGLAYVRALVRSMGGRIWCQSEPGNGTTFSFSVPGKQAGA